MLDFSMILHIIKLFQIEDLCNGSTPDSDSVCGGSNPSSSANNKSHTKRCGFYYWQRMRMDSKGRHQCVHWCNKVSCGHFVSPWENLWLCGHIRYGCGHRAIWVAVVLPKRITSSKTGGYHTICRRQIGDRIPHPSYDIRHPNGWLFCLAGMGSGVD